MSGDDELFQPALLDRLMMSSSASRELSARVKEQRLQALGIEARILVRSLRLLGLSAARGLLEEGSDRVVVFDVFPRDATPESLERTPLPRGVLRQHEGEPPLLGDLLEFSFREGVSRLSGNAALTASELRDAIVRDLVTLLETVSLEASTDLSDHPEVRTSVLNYGVAGLYGLLVAGADPQALVRRVEQAIKRFEPRILPDSLQVTLKEDERAEQGFVSFEVNGDFWGQPLPEHFRVVTEFDVASQRLSLGDVELAP